MRIEEKNEEHPSVAALLGGLTRVEAPPDFDAHVRARIACGRSTTNASRWYVFARAAVPAAVLLTAGGYAGYRLSYAPAAEVPAIREEAAAVYIPPTNVQPTALGTESPAPATVSAAAPLPAASRAPVVKKPTVDTDDRRPAGGSLDHALSEANTVSAGNSAATKAALSVRDVFADFGITAGYSNEGWRVSSAAGVAAAGGLQRGDVIEAVNGRAVSANMQFDADFKVRTMRIRRGAQTITLSF